MEKKTIKQLLVKKGNQRLDKFLSQELPGVSRAFIQSAIILGKVKVDETIQDDKSYKLSAGQRVEFEYEKPRLVERADITLNLVYEDGDVIVIDKPAGLVVHPNQTRQKPSVAAALVAKLKQVAMVGENEFRPGIVHRLDADTSGLLIIAKNQAAFEFLKEQFQARKIYKEYIALVHGVLQKSHGIIKLPIGRRTGKSRLETGFGRDALTEYWLEKALHDGVDKYSLVRVQLHTGRTHQIRVHFSSIGHPIAGDRVYGGQFKKKDSLKFTRQFLHARKLRLILPNKKEREFVSPLPIDLSEVLAKLKPNTETL